MNQWIRSRMNSQRGSVALEMAVIFPGLLLILSLLILGGRVYTAHNAVQQSAADAARAASNARTRSVATSQARSAAINQLRQQGLNCAPQVSVDSSGFNSRVGTTAAVSTTVTCDVPTGDLFLPGIPGTKTVSATAVSPLDTYRERR